MVEERRVEKGYAVQQEDGAIRQRLLARLDHESRAAQAPPRRRHLAVGDEAIVQGVQSVGELRPLAQKIERTVAGKYARARHDTQHGLAAYLVKLSGLLVGVVLQAVAPYLFVSLEVAQVNVPRGRSEEHTSELQS